MRTRRRRQNDDAEARVRRSVQRCMADRRWHERLPGGTTRHPSEFEYESLVQGTLAELEHTTDPCIAMEIAMDHLDEDPHYYCRLRHVHLSRKRRTNPSEPSWWDVGVTDEDEQFIILVTDNMDGTFDVVRFEYDTRGNEWSHAVWNRVAARSATRAAELTDSDVYEDALPPSEFQWRKTLPRWAQPYLRRRHPNPDTCGSGCVLAKHAWQPGETTPAVRSAARDLATKRWTLSPREARIKASLLR